MGLGLAAVYWIIKNHNGIVNVYCKKHKGTTFNIYLPLKENLLHRVLTNSKPNRFKGS